jgi:hypothetical protein
MIIVLRRANETLVIFFDTGGVKLDSELLKKADLFQKRRKLQKARLATRGVSGIMTALNQLPHLPQHEFLL